MTQLCENELEGELLAFVRAEFLEPDEGDELTAETPLLAYGILNSLRTARLLAFARDRFGVDAAGLAADPSVLASVRRLSQALCRV